MDETGAELPQQVPGNTEVIQEVNTKVKPEGRLLDFFKRRVFGRGESEAPAPQPKTEAQLLTERGNHQAHLDSINAWNKQETPHPADQVVKNEIGSKIEAIDTELRKIQEAKLPTPPTTVETPTTAVPEAPQEQPSEEAKAA